jgi:hypothetical protein
MHLAALDANDPLILDIAIVPEGFIQVNDLLLVAPPAP